MRRLILITTVLLANLGAAALAGPVEDGEAAYKRGDYAEALRLWRPAALSENARAQYWLGAMYVSGGGVSKDYSEAAKWFRLAAEHGDADAQVALGIRYAQGEGVPQDYAEAVKWYRRAAVQGNWDGQSALGQAYHDGRGVPLDYVSAYMWFNVSGTSSSNLAANVSRHDRDEMAKRMTPEQIAEAQKLARECLQRKFQNCN